MAYLTWNLRHDATNSPPGKRGLHRAPGPQRTHAVANAKVARRDSAKFRDPPQLTVLILSVHALYRTQRPLVRPLS